MTNGIFCVVKGSSVRMCILSLHMYLNYVILSLDVYVGAGMHYHCLCVHDNIRYNLASSLLLQVERLGLGEVSHLCFYSTD